MTIDHPSDAQPADAPLDPGALALSALAWVLTDDDRAARLLALTGLTPDALRAGLGDTGVQAAVLEFLAGHEPDLVLAADALNVAPATLAAAAEALARAAGTR